MINFKYIMGMLASFALFHTTLPYKAYAYLDPGTGSYLFQLAIAAILGGLYAIKVFWKNIKTFFTNIFSSEGKSEKR
jgi:hypothetical protein